jgi:hypothetical protein
MILISRLQKDQQQAQHSVEAVCLLVVGAKT